MCGRHTWSDVPLKREGGQRGRSLPETEIPIAPPGCGLGRAMQLRAASCSTSLLTKGFEPLPSRPAEAWSRRGPVPR
jgi:hypothetical protein